MSQNQELPERNDATPPDDNVGKVTKCKNVKEESVKKENDGKRKLSEISPPKRRKILHKMMTKYHKDPFYQQIDIAKKILKKLKVSNTQYFMGRIRQDMAKWIDENDPDDSDSDEDNADSKKKVLKDVQKKKENGLAATNDEEAGKKVNPEAVAEQPGPAEATNKKNAEHSETKPKAQIPPVSNNNVQKSSDSSFAIVNVKVEKEVPIIDLTIDLKKEIKQEIIMIDDDSSSASHSKGADNTTTNTPGGLPGGLPYPMIGYNPNSFYYPEAGFYPYYPNPYHDPNNNPMYNPYLLPYGSPLPTNYQYPYNYFYHPPCNSDYLPYYPVDHGSTQDPKLVNSQPNDSNISLPKEADKSTDADAEKTEVAGGLGKKQ